MQSSYIMQNAAKCSRHCFIIVSVSIMRGCWKRHTQLLPLYSPFLSAILPTQLVARALPPGTAGQDVESTLVVNYSWIVHELQCIMISNCSTLWGGVGGGWHWL